LKTHTKGQSALDLIVVVLVLFVIAFLGVLASKIWSSIDSGIQGTNIDATSKAASAGVATNMPSGFDIGIVVALGIAYIGLFITSRSIQTNPMFFFINVFFIMLALGFGAIMSNVFEATNTNDFALTRAAMPGTVFIMGHLLEFAILAVVIILIGLFAKPESSAY
jgi:hypothetical protein